MQQARLVARRGHLHRARDIVLRNAVERGLLLVDDQPVLGWSSSTYQSTSTTPSVRLPEVADAPRDARCAFVERRPVDLGDQRLSTGGPGGTSATLMRAP